MTAHSFSSPFARPFNPFIATQDDLVEVDDVAVEGTSGEVSYALVQSGPAVTSEETESHLDAVEVKVSWGTSILATTHLEQGKGFSIGSDGSDFVHPAFEGKTNLISCRGAGGVTTVVSLPVEASATVHARGESPRSVNGGDEIELQGGMRVIIELAPVTIEVSAVRAGKKFKVGFLASLATGAAAAIGLSFVGHAAIVASLAMFMPKMGADDAEAISREQVMNMQALLDASADREQEAREDKTDGPTEATGGGSKGGEPTKGEQGAAGTQTPKTAPGHMAFKGNDDKAALSRSDELKLAREFGMLGLLSSGTPVDGPSAPWGDSHMGQDKMNAMGALFGADAGDMMGYGFGLTGVGEGGGGNGAGVGFDGMGDLIGGGGNGPGKWGIGKGDKDGIGNDHGRLPGKHIAKAPPMPREGTVTTNGHLPPEVIQRIVRQNFGRFRMCYENGLKSNPTLNGRVVTKFVIGRDGAVSQAMDGGSDLPNQEVTSCVVRSFQNLSFPMPEGGVATVIYPITLNPGE
jgi:hypothetical protein